MLALIRRLVYKMGFRPKYGTVLYSPSTDLILASQEAMKIAQQAMINYKAPDVHMQYWRPELGIVDESHRSDES